MYPLSYVRPSSLADALAVLSEHDEARPLSGGMTLVPTLKQRLAAPSHLVDLSRLPELQGIVREGDTLVIGAATRHVMVAQSDEVRRAIPALAALAGVIADPQVRNRGTMGGSVANNDPAADYPAAMLGLGATLVTSQRDIAADDFFLGMFETALQPGELIVRIRLPVPRCAQYVKQRHKATGYAVAGVFVAQFDHGWRVAVTGAGTSVFRWQQAEAALDAGPEGFDAAHAALDESWFADDAGGSAAYRANLVRVLTRRALTSLTPHH